MKTVIDNAVAMTKSSVLGFLVLAVLVAARPLARADDDEAAARRSALLESIEAPANAIVKTWPGVRDRTLVGWTVVRPDADGGSELVDLQLRLLQASSGRVLARATLAKAWTSDAVAFTGISFDTADWAVAPAQRAFGVRADFSHPGRLTIIDETRLWLFEVRGPRIVPVLSNLLVDQRIESGQCGVYRERHATLAVAPTRSHGHADLKLDVAAMDATDSRVEPPATCADEVRRGWRGLLRFDGVRYAEPAPESGLD